MGRPRRCSRVLLWASFLGLGLLLEGGLVALLLLAYRWPVPFDNPFDYYSGTRPLFASGWGIALPSPMSPGPFSRAFASVWYGLNALWLGAFLLARRTGRPGQPILPVILGCALLFQATLVLVMPPLLTTDLYNYLAYGRMVAFHGLNPYTMLPSQMGSDPVLLHEFWDIVTPYGPLWTLLSAGIARAAGNSVFLGLILLKAVAGLSHLAIAWLGYRLAGEEIGPAVLLAWNPLFLLEGAGNGHNDLAMMALAMGGLLAFHRGKRWLGLVLLLLSGLVKYVSLFLLLFCLLLWLREQGGWGKRLRLLAAVAAVSLLLLAVFYAPFWQGPDTVLRNLREESTRIRLTPAAYARVPLRRLWSELPLDQADARALGTIALAQKAGLGALLLWQGIRLWQRRGIHWEEATSAWNTVALVYIVLFHNSIFPWYFVWPFGSAATQLQRPGARHVAILSGSLRALAALLYGIPAGAGAAQ